MRAQSSITHGATPNTDTLSASHFDNTIVKPLHSMSSNKERSDVCYNPTPLFEFNHSDGQSYEKMLQCIGRYLAKWNWLQTITILEVTLNLKFITGLSSFGIIKSPIKITNGV